MIDMDTGELADLWKDNKEPEFLAISYAIKMAMARLKAQIDSSRVYADIQNLQEDAVDEMAVELCVRGYDQSMPLDVKRNAVATSMLYYTYAGTTKAIRALIQSLYGDAHVDEWFDYDGDPYHFRVGIDITNQLQTVPMLTTDELAEILRGVTRISAHLDDVSFVIRPGLLIGQRSGLFVIDPTFCGVPHCGAYPVPHTGGYYASGGVIIGSASEETEDNPDPAGTQPSVAVSGRTEEFLLRSVSEDLASDAAPVEAAVVASGVHPSASVAGGFYAGGTVVVRSGSAAATTDAAEAGTVTSTKGG